MLWAVARGGPRAATRAMAGATKARIVPRRNSTPDPPGRRNTMREAGDPVEFAGSAANRAQVERRTQRGGDVLRSGAGSCELTTGEVERRDRQLGILGQPATADLG